MIVSSGTKRTSILLKEKQIDFLNSLTKKLERKCHKKIPRGKIMNVLIETLTCIEPEIGPCASEEEIGRQLLKCLKKAIKKSQNS